MSEGYQAQISELSNIISELKNKLQLEIAARERSEEELTIVQNTLETTFAQQIHDLNEQFKVKLQQR